MMVLIIHAFLTQKTEAKRLLQCLQSVALTSLRLSCVSGQFPIDEIFKLKLHTLELNETDFTLQELAESYQRNASQLKSLIINSIACMVF